MLKTSLLLLTLATVSLSTTPININSVEFTTSSKLYVAENIKTICQIQTDNITNIKYNIIGGKDKNKFTINPSTGDLSFLQNQNYESPLDSDLNNKYEVIIGLNKDMEMVNKKQFIITVLDIVEI